MPDDFDLERGDEELADKVDQRQGTSRTRTRKPRSGRSSNEGTGPSDSVVSNRVTTVFDRLVKNRRAAGDEELADAIEEDGKVMASSLVSLTTHVSGLRAPLIFLLSVAEPFLAFRRVGGILFRRWYEWRWRRAAQQSPEEEPETVAGAGYTAEELGLT